MAQAHSVSMSGGTSSRRHGHHIHGHDTGSLSMPSGRHGETEWEAKEALRQRELEEAKARAAQMEKTMRWWSECTANWREKWSKVRNERNLVREENKMLRSKLESALKDKNIYKRDKAELEVQTDHLKQELEKIHLLLLKHDDQTLLIDALSREDPERDTPTSRSGRSPVSARSLPSPKPSSGNCKTPTICNGDKHEDAPMEKPNLCVEEYILQGAVPRHAVELYFSNGKENALDSEDQIDSLLGPSENLGSPDDTGVESLTVTNNLSPLGVDTLGSRGDGGSGSSLCGDTRSMPGGDREDREYRRLGGHERSISLCSSSPDRESLMQRLVLRLQEATKTLKIERDLKANLQQTVEKLESEIIELKVRSENVWQEREKAIQTVRDLLQTKSLQADEVRHIRAELQDEASNREGMDRRLADLRAELERLQAENALEWGKRERLETEKLILERDNKKLRAELRDVQERLTDKRSRPSSATADAELRQCQQELADRNKELSNVRIAHSKLKKVFQDKSTELSHAVRRAEQYEAEVKRLRGRVEELKRDLAVAEDEVDSASNNIRKLQRENEELQEQVDSLQVQLQHLQTRLRNSSSKHLSGISSKHLLEDGSEEEDDDEDTTTY